MSWTKRQLIEQAFDEMGLAPHIFDITPEQEQSALRRMDAMVAGWNANGIRISYPLPSSPDYSNIGIDSEVPDYAVEAIYLGLAVRLAPSYGKTASPETKAFADMAYSNMVNQCAIPTPERVLPYTLARGAGVKPWRNFNNPFVAPAQEQIKSGSDNNIQLY
jgi:hypothetical protein